ncbi:MAG TPA: DUF350 domain-containing protein [Caulobacteraceae bacterium]|nr:DUF350 domain-containing protein [Caulobacteraceae bacterium]
MPADITSPEIQAFATGFPITLLHFAMTLVLLIVGAGVYILLTPHKEIRLIREGNVAAALSLGGALVGLAVPLAVSLGASTSAIEIVLWGVATIAVQLLVFRLIEVVLHSLPKRIQEGEIAAATLLVGAKLSTAMILAAAMGG